jgi:copper transport protein
VLVAEPPPKALAGTAPAGPFTATETEGDLTFDLTVDPAAAGGNVIHLYLLDPTGRPALVSDAQISGTPADGSLGTIDFREAPAGPGHWVVTGARFPAAGDWEVRVEARRGDFEQTTAIFEVPVR